jgi:transcriptional regulator with XRE-family HTH domain
MSIEANVNRLVSIKRQWTVAILSIMVPNGAMAGIAPRETAFGKRLRQAYLHRNMSQHDLEKAIGVSQGTVSRYISGDRKPTGEILAAIVSELGVSLGWLVHGEGSPDYADAWRPPGRAASKPASAVLEASTPRRAKAGVTWQGPPDEYPEREALIIALGERLDPRVRKLLVRLKGPPYEAFRFADWLAKAKELRALVAQAERDYEGA